MTASLVELTADMTRTVTALIDRRDIVVRLDPALPVDGQFDGATAHISINLTRVCDPQTVHALQERTKRIGDDRRLLGVLVHEAAHAEHTPIRQLPPHLVDWVDYLEEPRIEALMCDRHPHLVPAVAAAAAAAVGAATVGDGVDAIRVLILVGGRVTAGVFTRTDVADILTQANEQLSPDDAATVEAIVAAATAAADDQTSAMVQWAQQLFDVASRYGDPSQSESISHVCGRGPSPDDAPDEADSTDTPGPADDSGHRLDTAAPRPEPHRHDRTGIPDSELLGHTHPPAKTGVPADQEVPPAYIDGDPKFFTSTLSKESAEDWFTVRPLPPEASTSRAVTAADRVNVRTLQSWLAGNDTEAPVETVIASALPRGRLNPTELMRATAQHELGLTVTATPWRRRKLIEHPTDPIELGIICDRSQSMARHLPHVATVAWTLQHSIVGARGRSRAWAFGTQAHVLPEQRGDRITIPNVDANTIALLPAIVDYQRWVRHEHAAKVLVIISDGALYGDPVRQQLARLATMGVKIIGIVPRPTAVAALANHLPDRSPVETLGPNLLAQIQQHLLG